MTGKIARNLPIFESWDPPAGGKPRLSVNQKPPKKKKPSPSEQAKVYRKLLDSGSVKNKAALARKFGVSRAWVTKVLGSK